MINSISTDTTVYPVMIMSSDIGFQPYLQRVLTESNLTCRCEESNMFNLFKKNPQKKLQKAYEEKLTEAMHAQRNGDIRGYSMLQEEAEAIYSKLEALGKAS